jgi:uncharacterized membrane protein
MSFLPKNFLFHPAAVHFPIALWLTSALFDLLFLRTGDRFHLRAARILIGLGLLGATLAIGLGFVDYLAQVKQDVGQAFINRHTIHQWFAFASTAVYAVSFVVRSRRTDVSRRWIAVLTIAGAILIGVAGYLGGDIRLVM